MTEIIYTPHPDYIENAKVFFKAYDFIELIDPCESNYNKLVPKPQRVCRFCNQSSPSTTFRKDAHLIPELLGNKTFFSDFECDSCNQFFDKSYENDLANFLGIGRTLAGVKGKNGIPGFTSPNKSIKAKSGKSMGNETLIVSREDITNGAIEIDKTTGKLTLRSKRNPFVPINVYKILLKITLSVLDSKIVKEDYEIAIDFVMKRLKSDKFSGCLISGYSLPLSCNFPLHVFIFKKKNIQDKIHTHVIALYFQNWILSIPVPLNKNDLFFYNQSIELPLYPPMFPSLANVQNLVLTRFEENFSYDKKVKDVEDVITILPKPEDLSKAAFFDVGTNEITIGTFNPGEIIKIVIQRNDGVVNLPELTKLLREEE